MKSLYSRFHIALMAFAFSLAAAYVWNGISFAWTDISVDLPETKSAEILEVAIPREPQSEKPTYYCDEIYDQNDRESCLYKLVFADRDMSLYADGGRQGCGLTRNDADSRKCTRSIEKARRFVWDHWKMKKRGHVSVARASDEAEWVTHLFIEPDDDGGWRVAERTMPMRRREPGDLMLDDLVDIVWKRATDDEKRYGLKPGTMYLQLSTTTGDSLIL